MKIAISSTGDSLDSLVDPRFGRSNKFIVIDTDTMNLQVVENTSIYSAHGAGIGAAQKVASMGVKAVITGNVGPNAQSALSASGVEIYTILQGTVRDAVDLFKKGALRKVGSPTVGGHFGQGRGGGGGRGRRPV
jgi:predicted Fe-Mo cluster-binding NifX family protein